MSGQSGKGGQGRKAGNPFWEFSLSVYSREDAAAACLALQDRHGVDVNLVLYCVWAGSRGRSLAAAELISLAAATRSWQADVVTPLRAVRRHLKTAETAPKSAIEQLRTHIKAAELEAEAVEQQILFDALALAADHGTPAIAGGNMVAYLEAQDITPDAADVANLAAILRGCYPELPPLQAVWAVTG